MVGDNPLDPGDVEADIGSATYQYGDINNAGAIINAFGGCAIGSLDFEISVAPGPSSYSVNCCPDSDFDDP
ncbi:hypothetical protein, partial [Phenylobacterium sp.]|uniref:hypothetical protein n=1 Tax=Phenylobacterium sp. TaxID=1871053 RepID=UPI0025E57612